MLSTMTSQILEMTITSNEPHSMAATRLIFENKDFRSLPHGS